MKQKFTFLMAALMLLTTMVLPGKVVGQSRTTIASWVNQALTANTAVVADAGDSNNLGVAALTPSINFPTAGTNAYYNGSGGNAEIVFSSLTLTNYSSITLTFYSRGSAGGTITASYYNGSSYTTISTTAAIVKKGDPKQYTISDIPSSATQIKLHYNGTSGSFYFGTPVFSGTITSPTCTVSPASWGFGSVVAGTTTSQKTFTVTTANLTSALTLTASTGYSVTPASIAQNATSTSVTVTCTPTVVGEQNGTLTISGGGLASNVVVNLTATGTCAPAANALAYDDVNLVLNGASINTVLSPNTGTGNGGDITYTIQTNPNDAGSIAGSTFTATAVGDYVVRATQAATGIYCSETVDFNISVVGTDPVCTIDEELYDFGSVGVGLKKQHDFTITTLNLDEEITLSISDNHYSLSTTTIDEDGTTTLTITFEPTTTGVVEADLTISGCGFYDELLATLAGTGVQTYTVNFNPGLGGSGPSSVTNVEGYQITLEGATASTACQEDGGWTTFAGWTTATTLVNENTAPTPLYTSGSTYNIPNGGATLNAVYSKSNTTNGSVTFSECGYSNQQEVSSVDIDDHVSVALYKGTNANNAPKYFSTGSAIRCYGGNYFTISSDSGNLTAITLSFSSGEDANAITTDGGTYSNGSWSGSASSVTFNIGGTTGHRRIAGIAVTYGGSTSYAIAPSCIPQVKTPTFSVDEGFYTETKSVSISCETTGATIKYTLDGTTPSASNGTVYSTAISVAQTTTIKAIAILADYDDSEVAMATYTINNATHPYTVAQARAAIDANLGLTNVYATGIVSTAGTALSDGKITYSISEDGNPSNELTAYQGKNLNNTDFSSLDDIKVGDVVVIYGTLQKFNDIYEFQSGNYLHSITHTPTIIISNTALSDMVSIVGLEGETDTENWSNAKSFTVSGSNLTHNITLTLSSTADFEMSTNGSTYLTDQIQLDKGDGNVEATTIYVRLKAGATETAAQKTATITIASEDASNKSVALTGSVSYARLTYDGNGSTGGTVPTDNNNYTYNEEVEVAAATPTRTGYDFANWNTQADGQGANSYDPEEKFNITASTTLYAKWDPKNYKIGKATMVGGDVAVKINNTEVTEAGTGLEVTLVVTPATNYSLATLTVNNGAVTLSPAVSSSVSTYTFTMPTNDVIVAATFTKDPHTWNLAVASYNTPTSEDQVTWHSNYADMVVNKADATTNANNYLGGDANNRTSSRFYKNSELTISPAQCYKINSIVFEATSNGYATALQESTWTNASATVVDNIVTITPSNTTAAVSATISNTCGFTQVKVYNEFYIPVNGSSVMTGDVTIPVGEFVAVTSPIKVDNNQTLTVNGTLINTNAANLIIEDGGQLILNNTNSAVKAKVQKTTEASTTEKVTSAWNAISSSVDNVAISTFIKDESVGQNQHNVYRYDEATVYWQEYRNTSNAFENLTNGRGYLYRSLISGVEFAGDVNVGNIDCSGFLSWSCDEYSGRYKGFNLIGNPFTHDITWSNITNKENISGDGYYTLESDGTWNTQTTGGTIAPMQAFLIQATGANPELTIANTVGGGKGDDDRFGGDQIMFNVENSEYSDVAYVLFKEGHGLNKIEHRNDRIPMIYIIDNDENYAIADMPDNTSVINLGFEAMTMGKYTISLKAKGQYSYMHLFDKLTGDDVDMLVEDGYTFIGSQSDRKDRFVLHLNYNAANIDNESDIFAYQSGSDIIISGEGELQIFDITGRKVMTTAINGVEAINGLNNGVYIFKLEGKTQKIVVR